MNSFLKMPQQEQRLAYIQVEARLGLQAASVEKDFWVCWTLRELARLPGIGESLIFKGGTSLSKAWKLIERFSEDIDLVVDKEVLGYSGRASPDQATSKKDHKRRLKGLTEACRNWVQVKLLPDLVVSLKEKLESETGWTTEVDPDATDGQCLLFQYPGVFQPQEAGYVRPVVKIELGARSDYWPAEDKIITPYLAEAIPAVAPDAEVLFPTLVAERTFWEKACLLHEETFRPQNKSRKSRLARHYYDLWCLITKGVAQNALSQRELFDRVVEHREIFFRWTWVDYSTLRPGSFRLLPLQDQEADWRKDYEAMRGPMFFGETPTFDEILKVVGDFEKDFNSTGLRAEK